MHPHEDLDLRFAELRTLIEAAREGALEGATEKTDGMNLVFTWDVSGGDLKVARSGGDIKRGGLDAQALAGRFTGRSGDVVAAFRSGFEVLRRGLGSRPASLLREAFGPRGDVWYSAEVIDQTCPNVIMYDVDCVVLHAHGSFRLVDGKVDQRVETTNLDALFETLPVATPGIRGDLCAPASMRLRLSPVASRDALDGLDLLVRSTGASYDTTLREHVVATASRQCHDASLPARVLDALVGRMAGVPGALNLAQIRRLDPSVSRASVDGFVDQEDAMLAESMAPIEHLTHLLGTSLLSGVRSTMVRDHDAEVDRLRQKLELELRDVGEESTLRRHVSRLRAAPLTSSAEGIVFRHSGKAYKLTGLFGPLNQVLGFRRYGWPAARAA